MSGLIPVSPQDPQLRQAFERVFASAGEFDDEPFRSEMRARALLYVTFDLQRDELEAVAEAARAASDDDGFFIRTSAAPGEGSAWLVWPDGFDAYVELQVFDPPILISPAGAWGLRIYADNFGVAGGSAEFVETLLERYPLQYPDTTADDFERAGLDPRSRKDRDRFHRALFATEPTVRGHDQVKEFLRVIDPDRPWPRVPRLLEHIYGAERARELLVEAGLWKKYDEGTMT